MAFKKTIAQRLLNVYRITNPYLSNFRTSSSSTAAKALAASNNPDRLAPDPGDDGIFRRFIHRKAANAPSIPTHLPGEGLLLKLREMGIVNNRIRLDVLRPPTEFTSSEPVEERLTVQDVRKILKLSQMEIVKARLRQIEKTYVLRTEFVEICTECCGNRDQGEEMARMLDESGTVIVLGNIVLLRPEQVGFPYYLNCFPSTLIC